LNAGMLESKRECGCTHFILLSDLAHIFPGL
jgi:hypothetical protein